MAKQVVEVTVDDLTGQPIEGTVHTVTLMVNDRSTQVDLSEENAKRLDTFLAPYFSQAPKQVPAAPAGKTNLPTQKTTASSRALNEIRAWAKKNGYTVSNRGRIPFAVMDAYTRSHMVTTASR